MKPYPLNEPSQAKRAAICGQALKRRVQQRYNVFVRDFWKPAESPGWPDNREPHLGGKEYIAEGVTWARARAICAAYNDTHDPGPMSRKAEFEEAT